MRPVLLVLCFTPLMAAASGDAVCAACHAREASHFPATPMAQAAETAARCDILKTHPDLQFQEGAYHTEIKRQGDRSMITVTSGAETFTIPILYAMGKGRADLRLRIRWGHVREPRQFL